MNLLTLPITTALTAFVGPTHVAQDGGVRSLALQGNFTYGSSGTTATVWVQTSFDGGATWCDVANFAFTTSSIRRFYILNASTSITSIATPTDGSLTSATCVDGIIGPIWRTKTTSTGTYAGSTVLAVDVYFNGALTAA